MNAYEALRQLGAATAAGVFSGGHDEGGYDEFALYDAAGRELRVEFGPYETLGGDERLAAIAGLLESILDGEYGGFAFDGYVSGTVTLDAATGKATISGTEEVPQSQSFDRQVG